MEKLRKHIEDVTPISDSEFEYIKTFFTPKKVKKHQYLVQEGDAASHEYLVMEGIFRLYHSADDGKEHIIQFANANWWMADYNAYFNQKKATMHIECMEGGEVLCLTLTGRANTGGRAA